MMSIKQIFPFNSFFLLLSALLLFLVFSEIETGQLFVGPRPRTTKFLLSDSDLLYGYTNREDTLRILEQLPEEQLAPLTVKAQRLLFDWQHPTHCKGRKFIVSEGNPHAGLGSNIHVGTSHVAFAFFFNAIFLWSRNAGEAYTDIQTCFGSTNFECFFDPPSNCTLEDTLSEGAEVIYVRSEKNPSILINASTFVPEQFVNLWRTSGMPFVIDENTGHLEVIKYWFRLQVAAYLSRFNARSLNFMSDLRSNIALMKEVRGSLSRTHNFNSSVQDEIPRNLPNTFPPGTISIHIRHGDKISEMPLVPTEKYFKEAIRLVKLHPFSLANYQIFLSTIEATDAIQEATSWIMNGTDRQKAFFLYYWDVPRDESKQRGELTLIWWLQLLLALECDLWIGTRGSNWNRLIDELRCVWVAKCQNIYSEVGDEEVLSW